MCVRKGNYFYLVKSGICVILVECIPDSNYGFKTKLLEG